MFTLIEKYEQRKFKKNGKPSYQITIKLIVGPDKFIHKEYDIFASNEDEALEIGERLRFREQEKIDEGDTLIDRLGLNFKEIRNNKLGLILPWKDPVNKRSISRGMRLPALRAFQTIKVLKKAASKNYSVLNRENLNRADINNQIVECVKGYIFCSFITLFATYTLAINLFSGSVNLAYWLICFLFILVFCISQLAKLVIKHKKLLNWRSELDGK